MNVQINSYATSSAIQRASLSFLRDCKLSAMGKLIALVYIYCVAYRVLCQDG
jgi:succinate dehydrogenase/fumarate reductase cytochrome b subunit